MRCFSYFLLWDTYVNPLCLYFLPSVYSLHVWQFLLKFHPHVWSFFSSSSYFLNSLTALSILESNAVIVSLLLFTVRIPSLLYVTDVFLEHNIRLHLVRIRSTVIRKCLSFFWDLVVAIILRLVLEFVRLAGLFAAASQVTIIRTSYLDIYQYSR